MYSRKITIFFSITDKFMKQFVPVVHNEIGSLIKLISVRDPPKKRYIMNQEIIYRMWSYIQYQQMDIPTFFSCANHLLRTFNNKIIMQNLQDVDVVMQSTIHNISIFIFSIFHQAKILFYPQKID